MRTKSFWDDNTVNYQYDRNGEAMNIILESEKEARDESESSNHIDEATDMRCDFITDQSSFDFDEIEICQKSYQKNWQFESASHNYLVGDENHDESSFQSNFQVCETSSATIPIKAIQRSSEQNLSSRSLVFRRTSVCRILGKVQNEALPEEKRQGLPDRVELSKERLC